MSPYADRASGRIFLSAPAGIPGACSGHGAWRSSVARLLWEQEVPGSNPGAPIGNRTRDGRRPDENRRFEPE